MTKKIFAISTLLLALVIAALFVYNFVFKVPSNLGKSEIIADEKTSAEGKQIDSSGVAANEELNTGANRTTSDSAILALSDEAVFGAVLAPDGQSIYYFLSGNSQLNQVDFSGKLMKVLSTDKFENAKGAAWNNPRNKVIIKTEPAPEKNKFFLLDLAQKKVVPLKDSIDSVIWSSQGDRIVYKYYDSKTRRRTISISDPDGSNWRDLTDFNYQYVSLASLPNSSKITYWTSPNAFTLTSVNLIDSSGENKQEVIKDRYGTDLLWAPDGKKGVASCSDEKGGHKIYLYSLNADGGQFQTLMLPTFASKCVWSRDSVSLYCAMAGSIPEHATLPNDWQDSKITTADTFWKINVSTGEKSRLVDPEKIKGSYDAVNLFLSQDEKTLFFTSKSEGKLYKFQL